MSHAAFDPYAPPRSDVDAPVQSGRFAAHRIGDDLCIDKRAPWPAICCKCSTRNRIQYRGHTFVWATPWFWLGLAGGWVILAIVYFIARKRARVELPLCRRCNGRWRTAQLWRALVLVWAITAPIAAVLLDAGPAVGLTLVTSMFVVPIATILLYVRPRVVRARRIDDRMITLRGVAPGAIEAIFEAARG